MLMTPVLLERMRNNYMIVEVWDKKVSADGDKVGHVFFFFTSP